MRHAALVLVILLAGCSQEQLLQKFASPEDQATARAYIDKLRAHDFEGIESDADQSVRGPAVRGTLAQMADLFPPGNPTSVKLVGAQTHRTSDAATVNMTFEYNFDEHWLLANVAIKNQNDVKTIVGFHVQPEALALERQNAFTLVGRAPVAYVVLGAALASAIFTLYALLLCIRTRLRSRRKWPWILFILLGFGKFAVNWTTGQWSISLISVQLFSASEVAALYGPWTVAVSVPLGAILFVWRRRSLSAPLQPLTAELTADRAKI